MICYTSGRMAPASAASLRRIDTHPDHQVAWPDYELPQVQAPAWWRRCLGCVSPEEALAWYQQVQWRAQVLQARRALLEAGARCLRQSLGRPAGDAAALASLPAAQARQVRQLLLFADAPPRRRPRAEHLPLADALRACALLLRARAHLTVLPGEPGPRAAEMPVLELPPPVSAVGCLARGAAPEAPSAADFATRMHRPAPTRSSGSTAAAAASADQLRPARSPAGAPHGAQGLLPVG